MFLLYNPKFRNSIWDSVQQKGMAGYGKNIFFYGRINIYRIVYPLYSNYRLDFFFPWIKSNFNTTNENLWYLYGKAIFFCFIMYDDLYEPENILKIIGLWWAWERNFFFSNQMNFDQLACQHFSFSVSLYTFHWNDFGYQ